MHKDRDFELQSELPFNAQALTQDLALSTLFNAMSRNDRFIFDVSKQAILSPLNDQNSILYRQGILKDCLSHSSVVMDIYALAVEAIDRERKDFWVFSLKHTSSVLGRAVELLGMFAEILTRLRDTVDEHAEGFGSAGFNGLFAMLKKELDDEFFATLKSHLARLTFPNGVLISAELGKGNKGRNHVLRRSAPGLKRSWVKRLFETKKSPYMFQLHPRDTNGFNALSELRDRGINVVANALAQSTDHILSFFRMLRTELAFYIGCLNLYEQLSRKGEPIAFPEPAASGERKYTVKGLYDVCLSLNVDAKIVGNNIIADDRDLIIITGANQGGKSTFLRSVGVAQLMMQCGMFVPAERLCANVSENLFTHFKREEDASMKSGKLDEELARMSDIVDHLTPNSTVLFNESFAATNEREGSEIARQITTALVEKQIKVFFVSHLYDFARGFVDNEIGRTMFLRAEREPDGTRSFELIEGSPLDTSYGKDLYERLFGTAPGHDRPQVNCDRPPLAG
jgi:DNA mismatch repair ATPase MutS